MKQQATQTSGDSVFLYLLILTGFFFLLEISFFIQCNKAYLSDFTFMSSQLQMPVSVLPGIVYFVFAQLFVHVSYCVLAWLLAESVARLFKIQGERKIILCIGVWMVGMMTILTANQFFFPNSKFSELSATLLSAHADKILFAVFSLCMFVISVMALLTSRFLKAVIITILLAFCGEYYFSVKTISNHAATEEKPNIIIVGIDSLRPDYLGYFGDDHSTPFFDTFLNSATVFSEAITPLARTFPSWTSILSGEYPNEIGMRSNLASQSRVDFSQTLPSLIRKQGYETLFATDETRFSNIDKPYGFDTVVTPPMGLNDFLLGTFNDFPLSNLLVNTPIGKWLFPYSYANRPVYFTYNPDSFLRLIEPHILRERDKPLLLAIHFCLPHHPYLWGSLSGYDYEPLARYEMSVKRVDKQVNDFFHLLNRAHLLDHAIVVLLSDHGEALELPGDRLTENESFSGRVKNAKVPRFYPTTFDDVEEINQSVGHGTDVLSLTQYHTLLAVKLYGVGKQHIGVVRGVVSLLSIKPTILSFLNHKPQNRSLMPFITGNGNIITQREPLFIESDFTPDAIRTVYPDTQKVLLEGIEIFQIDPQTTRLVVRDDMETKIIKSKQLAVIDRNWILALYPQNNHYQMPVLINLTTGQWTNDLKSPLAQHSPSKQMLDALRTFYGNEIL